MPSIQALVVFLCKFIILLQMIQNIKISNKYCADKINNVHVHYRDAYMIKGGNLK